MFYKNKVLVVDDDIITRNIVNLIFKDNFEVLEAENGETALKQLGLYRQELAFIICDVSMPVMDGFTFMREKNKHVYNKGIPVIMITAAGDDQIRRQAISLGAADFVDKPLDPKVVRLRVNNVLSNYGAGYAYNDSLQREFLDLINTQLRGGTFSIYDREDYPFYYISEALARYLGYENAAELNDSLDGKWINMFTPEEFASSEKIVKTQLQKKGRFRHEFRLRKKDGSYIWVSGNGKYSDDPASEKRLVALCVDITDTKEAEERARYQEQLADIAMESTGISVWEYDFAEKCIIQGQNSKEIHGFETIISNVPQALVDSQYVHPDSAKAFMKMFDDLKNGAKKVEGVFKVRKLDQSGYWYEHIRYTNTFGKDGKPYRAIGISNDVTEQKKIQAQYQREIDFNKALSPDIFATARINLTQNTIDEIHTDIAEEQEQYKNAAFLSLPGLLADSACISREAEEYFRNISKNSIMEAYNCGKRIINYEFLKLIDGASVWVRFELHIIEDPHNNDLLAFIYLKNIDRQRREVEHLKELAQRDQMTGLYNHDTTIDLIKKYINEEEMRPCHALFVIDVNKFKLINDYYGHMQGDKVLIEVAKRIQSVFREDDIVGRVGGDEFMVLVKNMYSETLAEKKAQELSEITRFLYEHRSTGIDVNCSVGVAFHTNKCSSFDELYRKADAAMYKAKKFSDIGYAINSD